MNCLQNCVLYMTSLFQGLLDVSISACLTDNSSLDELVKIRLLLFIVKNASNCCQFAIPVRDSLSRLKKYFLKIYNDKKVQEFIMEIVVLLIDSVNNLVILKYYDIKGESIIYFIYFFSFTLSPV